MGSLEFLGGRHENRKKKEEECFGSIQRTLNFKDLTRGLYFKGFPFHKWFLSFLKPR